MIFALVGATATGKTDLGESLAERLDAEIVCADSRQFFRELDVGTGKPPADVRAARPHHLFDALSLEERPSAGWYARTAAPVIEAIRARGRRPLLVGGAGLYVRALQKGLAPEPVLDPNARARLRARYAEAPVAELHERLRTLDPASATTLRPSDRQRISRALEVVELSGKPMGWWHTQPAAAPIAGEWRVVEVRVPAAELADRIEARTAWMFEHGLVAETRALIDAGREAPLRALRAVGYDEALDLVHGRIDETQARARTSTRTRQLAKRQRTWFRHQITASVIAGGKEGGGADLLAEAVRRLAPE